MAAVHGLRVHTDAPRGATQVTATPEVVRPQLGLRTAVLQMPRTTAPAAATTTLARVPRSLPESHVNARRASRGIAFAAALPLVALLVALAVVVLRRMRLRRTPTMDSDALLRDDTDLLRELDADAGTRVHDDRGGHPHAASPPAWGRDLLPDGRGRARRQGGARGGGAGTRAPGVRRPDRRSVAGVAPAPERRQRLLHQDER